MCKEKIHQFFKQFGIDTEKCNAFEEILLEIMDIRPPKLIISGTALSLGLHEKDYPDHYYLIIPTISLSDSAKITTYSAENPILQLKPFPMEDDPTRTMIRMNAEAMLKHFFPKMELFLKECSDITIFYQNKTALLDDIIKERKSSTSYNRSLQEDELEYLNQLKTQISNASENIKTLTVEIKQLLSHEMKGVDIIAELIPLKKQLNTHHTKWARITDDFREIGQLRYAITLAKQLLQEHSDKIESLLSHAVTRLQKNLKADHRALYEIKKYDPESLFYYETKIKLLKNRLTEIRDLRKKILIFMPDKPLLRQIQFYYTHCREQLKIARYLRDIILTQPESEMIKEQPLSPSKKHCSLSLQGLFKPAVMIATAAATSVLTIGFTFL